jgi:hypothetical protein
MIHNEPMLGAAEVKEREHKWLRYNCKLILSAAVSNETMSDSCLDSSIPFPVTAEKSSSFRGRSK